MLFRDPFGDRLAARMSGGFLLAEGDAGGEQGGAGGGSAAAGSTQRSALTAAAAGAAEQSAGGDQAAGAGNGAAAGADNPWGDNWRSVAGEDAAAKAILERITTPQDLIKKLVNQEQAIRSRQKAPSLPDNATPEEVKAFRQALGVPEAPDGYGLKFAEGVQVSDGDKAALDGFQKAAHDMHLPPAQAKALFDWWSGQTSAAAQQRAEQVHELTLQNVADLRNEYKGREYARNLSIAAEFFASQFDDPQEGLQLLETARLPNGIVLGSYAPFVKALVKAGRAAADDEALIGGDGAGGGKSIDDEYQDLVTKSVSKPREMTAHDHSRLTQLAEARVNREQRAGRFAI